MTWQLLAETLTSEPGIIIGSSTAALIGGIIIRHYWPKRERPSHDDYNREFCDERHRNLEQWMGRIDGKLAELIKRINP